MSYEAEDIDHLIDEELVEYTNAGVANRQPSGNCTYILFAEDCHGPSRA